jgi:hypothetical protein
LADFFIHLGNFISVEVRSQRSGNDTAVEVGEKRRAQREFK